MGGRELPLQVALAGGEQLRGAYAQVGHVGRGEGVGGRRDVVHPARHLQLPVHVDRTRALLHEALRQRHHYVHPLTRLEKTRRERLKSALYLRLKKRKVF